MEPGGADGVPVGGGGLAVGAETAAEWQRAAVEPSCRQTDNQREPGLTSQLIVQGLRVFNSQPNGSGFEPWFLSEKPNLA